MPRGKSWKAQEARHGSDGAETVDNDALSALKEARAATYDADAIAELKYMLEEEKLAGDVYETFADLYDARVFSRIARSEDRHFNALLNQAEKIGVDVDAILFKPAGEFVDPELQELYDSLIATGQVSLEAALGVGVTIELTDLTDLQAAIDAVEGTQLARVYGRLLDGSENHLEAFESLLA